jgi:hypothetical protein
MDTLEQMAHASASEGGTAVASPLSQRRASSPLPPSAAIVAPLTQSPSSSDALQKGTASVPSARERAGARAAVLAKEEAAAAAAVAELQKGVEAKVRHMELERKDGQMTD